MIMKLRYSQSLLKRSYLSLFLTIVYFYLAGKENQFNFEQKVDFVLQAFCIIHTF